MSGFAPTSTKKSTIERGPSLHVQGGVAILVPGFDFGAGSDQHVGDEEVSVLRGKHQNSVAVVCGRAYDGSVL